MRRLKNWVGWPWIISTVKWVLFAVVIAVVARALWIQVGSVQWSQVHFAPQFIALAAAATFTQMLVKVPLYKSLLTSFCKSPPWSAMMAVTWLPPLGKYIPGKVASVAGVIYLLRTYQVPARIAVSLVLMANGAMAILGVMLSVPMALWEPVQKELPSAWIWCVVVMLAGLVCLHPTVFKATGNFVLTRLKRQKLEMVPSLKGLVYPILTMLAQYLLLGLAMWFVVRSLTPISWSWIGFYICACALASTVGFVAFFAPAGLGVREGVLMLVLAASADQPIVSVGVVITRLLQTIADVGFAGVAVAILKWGGQNPPAAEVSALTSQKVDP